MGFWRRLWGEEDEEKKKFERARGQRIRDSECWHSEMRWIWGVWIELKNRYEKRWNVWYERRAGRSEGDVDGIWDVMV